MDQPDESNDSDSFCPCTILSAIARKKTGTAFRMQFPLNL